MKDFELCLFGFIDLWKKEHNWTLIEKLKLILDILSACELLHLRGEGIGNINPRNIIIALTKGQIYVNFREHMSVFYQSPESFRYFHSFNKKELQRMDVFSVACVIATIINDCDNTFEEMVINRYNEAQKKQSIEIVIYDLLRLEFRPYFSLVQPKLNTILKKCLSFDPQKRPSIYHLRAVMIEAYMELKEQHDLDNETRYHEYKIKEEYQDWLQCLN